MPRSLWKGAISFGLVTIPVGLVSAEDKGTEIAFHNLDKKTMSRVKQKRVAEATGEEVPWDDIVKGYEYAQGPVRRARARGDRGRQPQGDPHHRYRRGGLPRLHRPAVLQQALLRGARGRRAQAVRAAARGAAQEQPARGRARRDPDPAVPRRALPRGRRARARPAALRRRAARRGRSRPAGQRALAKSASPTKEFALAEQLVGGARRGLGARRSTPTPTATTCSTSSRRRSRRAGARSPSMPGKEAAPGGEVVDIMELLKQERGGRRAGEVARRRRSARATKNGPARSGSGRRWPSSRSTGASATSASRPSRRASAASRTRACRT